MTKSVTLLSFVFMVYPAASPVAAGSDLYAYYTRLDYRIPLSEIRMAAPFTDPEQILGALGRAEAGLLPLGGAGELLGGHKGYDLATIVEILSASLSGGAFMKDLLGFAPDGSRRPYMIGHFFLAIDIEHFLPVEVSKQITGGIMRALQASRRAPGQDRIYVAGEKEWELQQIVREQGVPVNGNLRQELEIMRDEMGIEGYEGYF